MAPTSTPRRLPCAVSCLLLTLLQAGAAQAQAPTPARPDPLDPTAQVPAVRYATSLAQFRGLGDDKPVAWRDANDTVARIGGWRVYTREAQQPDAPSAGQPDAPAQAPAPPATPAPRPMPPGPAGHKH